MKTTEITLNGETFVLDLDKAREFKVLTPKPKLPPYPLRAGDVYVPADKYGYCNPFRLVQATYKNSNNNGKCWALLGMEYGCGPNSDDFHHELHSLDEISAYLLLKKMVFSHNTAKKSCFSID